MPGYRGHLTGGIFVYLLMGSLIKLFFFIPSHTQMLEWLCFTLMGSLFPDIDTKSKGQQLFYWILICLLIFLFFKKRYFLGALCGIIGTIPLLVKHRGIFHKPWFIGMFGLGAMGVSCSMAPIHSRIIVIDILFFVIGALSHIWLDVGIRRKRKYL